MAYPAAKDESLKPAHASGEPMDTDLDQDRLAVMAHRAGQKLNSIFGGAYHEATHATEAVKREIRSHPVQSSLIALGTGYLLAGLFRRTDIRK